MADLHSGNDIRGVHSPFEYPLTLIDVGAGGGIDRRRWGRFRNLTVIGFEPDEREFTKLKNTERHRWFQVALYGSDGLFDLNVTRYQTGTSLLEPNLELIQKLNVPVSDFDILRKVPLQCRTLDALCSEYGLVPHVIKLDTQGTELDILRGGGRGASAVQSLQSRLRSNFFRSIKTRRSLPMFTIILAVWDFS